jgi:radical SAM protein with 4Fe4S-binding SPASM domain
MKLLNKYNFESILTFLFLQNRKPTYLIFFTTNKCEARCKHCFYWRETNQNTSELSKIEITELARNLGPMIQITITGGSPELRNDLYDILYAFIKYCAPINITLCSNGNYPEILYETAKKLLSDFKNLHLTIDISLDGLYEEHDSIRGIYGLFKNVIRSYSLLKDLKNDYPNFRLGCGLVVSGINEGTAVETAAWAINHLPIDNFTPVLVRGEPRDEKALNVQPDVFKNIADRIEDLLIKGDLKGYAGFKRVINSKDIVQKKLIYKIFNEKKPVVRCSALRETVVVYPDGKVGTCELRDESIGNLKDFGMNLKRMWKNPETRKIRNSIKENKCYCWHQCFLSASVIKSPVMWLSLFKTFVKVS